jgi:HSP20 family protein
MAFVTLRGDTDVLSELERFREDFGRMFEGYGAGERDEARRASSRWHPRANVVESDEELRVLVPLPGIDPATLSVSVEGAVLRVSGERQQEPCEGRCLRAERVHGAFERSVELPVPVNSRKVDAKYRHGVLDVSLPKAAEAKPRRIQVRGE